MSLKLKGKQIFSGKERGQSFAEFSAVAVVLLVMVIGLFEVGYGLWGYLTLLNVNRESARFSIRPNVLDFSTIDQASIGYENIINHALTSNADQLKLQEYLDNAKNSSDPDVAKAAVIVTHVVVDTGKPCEDLAGGCCDAANFTPYDKDDLILNGEMPGYEHLRYVYPDPATASTTFESRLDLNDLIYNSDHGLVVQNNKFNCELYRKSGLTDFSDNSVMVVETFYQQPQLLGFPLYSWFANPLPLYAQTILRVDSNAEGRCAVLPIAVHLTTVQKMKTQGGEHDILQGDYEPNGEFGWLSWNHDQNNVYLNEELNNPNLSTHDYVDPTDATDTSLNVGDWINGLSGVKNSDDTRNSMSLLIGKTVLLPIYDSTAGSGKNSRYHVHSFAKIRIGTSDLPPGQGGYINGTLIEWPSTDACPGNSK